jgi:hypothetical protein
MARRETLKLGRFLAVDQYGTTYWLKTRYPRKELCERLGNQHVEKLYVTVDGRRRHAGYLIAGKVLTIHYVVPWKLGKTFAVPDTEEEPEDEPLPLDTSELLHR